MPINLFANVLNLDVIDNLIDEQLDELASILDKLEA